MLTLGWSLFIVGLYWADRLAVRASRKQKKGST
jgi:hypothetical protein